MQVPRPRKRAGVRPHRGNSPAHGARLMARAQTRSLQRRRTGSAATTRSSPRPAMSHLPIRSTIDAVIGETAVLTGPLVGGAAGRATAFTPLINVKENVAKPFGCPTLNGMLTRSVFFVM